VVTSPSFSRLSPPAPVAAPTHAFDDVVGDFLAISAAACRAELERNAADLKKPDDVSGREPVDLKTGLFVG
jgi:hypothetical protein